jgi:hypothetical protein
VDLGDSIQLLEQLAAIDGSGSTAPQPQLHEASRDELERYLEEASADPTSYSGNPLAWWREVGSKRFPRLSYLASDLLSIPLSTASVERIFSLLGNMIPPKRSCLNADVVTHGYSLRAWRAGGVYVASHR